MKKILRKHLLIEKSKYWHNQLRKDLEAFQWIRWPKISHILRLVNFKTNFTFWDTRTRTFRIKKANFSGCFFIYEHKHIGRFSNLHWCTFKKIRKEMILLYMRDQQKKREYCERFQGHIMSNGICYPNAFTAWEQRNFYGYFFVCVLVKAIVALRKNLKQNIFKKSFGDIIYVFMSSSSQEICHSLSPCRVISEVEGFLFVFILLV